ncbi:PREDICTED: uncharacterized protein LOC109169761 [Ipomoea nil]|uniref:uncharacterized protein LOC109169761 n=1 Tax=Ipomoea nil TaxID=35883 RepID=UPI00090108B8|nr:PREDICTED: uncharacterized protein LOC109169761 [Ipomoea nil]
MTDSDSQNASIADYDEEVEHLSDEEVDIMSYSPEAIYRPAPAPEQAAAQDTSSSSSGSSSSSSSGSGSSAMAEFGDEEAPLPPPAKISLGGKKKAKAKPAGEKEIPSARPLSTSTVTTGEGFVVEPSDVLITRVEVARGKEKVPEQGVREVGGMKRRREQRSPSPSVGRERDASSILARIGNAGRAKEDLGKMTPTQVVERIGYDLAEAQKALKKGNEDRALAEKVAHRAIEEAKQLKAQLGNPSELAQAVFKDSDSGSAFLTAARGTKVGEDLILSFGRWAFKAGQRKMLERARTRMEQALEGEDLQLVLSTLPPDLADPGPSPFSPKEKTAEQGGSSAAAASEKEAAGAREAAGAQEAKK